MESTNRMFNLFTPAIQRLVQFALVASIAFILGIAAAPVMPTFFARATTSSPAVAPSISRQVGTGTVYDGQALPQHAAARTSRHISTGSVYDGQPRAVAPLTAFSAAVHSGTGSAYDGQLLQQRAVSTNITRHSGTGTVYDGQTRASESVVSHAGTGTAYDGQPLR